MAGKSTIEWTQVTWNPVTGCTKISAGCKNCYAERMARRLRLMGSKRYVNEFAVTLHKDLLYFPKTLRAPRQIFVNSMSDLFHEEVPLEFIQKVFASMNASPQHAFQILTKRSERLAELANKLLWSENIWMGVTVEDNDNQHRIADLRKVGAAVRFISFEPLQQQAHRHNIPFFFKQWGGTNKKKSGKLLNGQLFQETPAFAAQGA